jgi:pimeloyl-ACP methyl ester carboxylesterase
MSTVQHVSLWSKSPALPMLETRPESKHSLIFIAGLSDTLATVPYLASLAEAIAPLDFSLIQPQLSSSLGGYGLSSLEADAQEICILIDHLQTRSIHPKPKDGKMVIMGHSTGCQDVAHLLSQHREGIQVDGAILQAPVSDREYFEAENEAGDDDYKLLEEATALVKAGKGSTLLERHIDAPRVAPPTFKEYEVNGDAFQDPAMTAYRFWSLNAKGGDDDFFSSDLTEERISEIWRNTIDRGHRVLAMLGKLE